MLLRGKKLLWITGLFFDFRLHMAFVLFYCKSNLICRLNQHSLCVAIDVASTLRENDLRQEWRNCLEQRFQVFFGPCPHNHLHRRNVPQAYKYVWDFFPANTCTGHKKQYDSFLNCPTFGITGPE